jgi:predicted nucleic acid-binding protein
MTERLAFDTNALVYLLQGVSPYAPWLDRLFASVEAGEREAVVSVVVEAELLVKPIRDHDTPMLQRIAALLAHRQTRVIPADRDVARSAARIRADLRLGIPDAFVVATAVATGCDALVGNDARCAKRVTQIPYIYLDDAVKT